MAKLRTLQEIYKEVQRLREGDDTRGWDRLIAEAIQGLAFHVAALKEEVVVNLAILEAHVDSHCEAAGHGFGPSPPASEEELTRFAPRADTDEKLVMILSETEVAKRREAAQRLVAAIGYVGEHEGNIVGWGHLINALRAVQAEFEEFRDHEADVMCDGCGLVDNSRRVGTIHSVSAGPHDPPENCGTFREGE